MKYFTTVLTILGIYLFVYACSDKPCTDDGCPGFNELSIPEPLEDIRGKLDIEEWIENPAVTSLAQKINLEYGVHKVVEKTYRLPHIDTSSNENFVQSLNTCIKLGESIQPCLL